MGRLSSKVLCEQSEKAWQSKSMWDALIGECYEYALPDRNPYWGNGTGRPEGGAGLKGQDKTSKKVFDSTLLNSAMKITNRLQSELFPIGDEWAKLTPGPMVDMQQRDQARAELHKLQKVLFLAIQLSNFDLSIAEWLLDLVIAGTACMLVQEGNNQNPIVFQTVPQSHVALREGAFGFIDGVFRKHKMRVSLIPMTWPKAKKVDLKDGGSGNADDDPEVDIIEVCYLDTVQEVWRYDVIVEKSSALKSSDNAQRIIERDYQRSPWSVGRWSKYAGEVQGRSLVMQALPDARTLSAVKKYLLQQAALAIGGVFLVRNDGSLNANSVRIYPGATIPVRATGGTTGASVAPLQVGGDINLAQLVIQDLVASINKIMLNEALPEIKDGIRTATEYLERLKEMQQSLGAPFARVLKEGIVPMLEAALQVLGEMGVVPMPNGSSIRLNGGEVSVTFNSPLVQQQSLREVEALLNAATMTRQIAGPQGGDQGVELAYKVEEIGGFVGEKVGVAPHMMRTKEAAKQLMKQAGEMAGAQAAPPDAANANAPQVGGAGGVAPQQMVA